VADDPAERLVREALQHHENGNPASALDACRRALEHDAGDETALMLSAYLEMPGPDYFSLLRQIHAALRPRTYVEIGVESGDTLRLAGAGTRAIGVDPKPQVGGELPPNLTLVTATSDEFFARHDPARLLGGLPVDLAFIDGMHHFEFALRDFINLERLCAPGSTILIHDCYPLNRLTAERERRSSFWSGDIWRLIVALGRHRPELEVHTIATPPTGLAVVRGLDPASRRLADRYDEVVAEMLALDYGMLEGAKASLLKRFPNEWPRIAAILGAGGG
jgi:hypothetical protein